MGAAYPRSTHSLHGRYLALGTSQVGPGAPQVLFAPSLLVLKPVAASSDPITHQCTWSTEPTCFLLAYLPLSDVYGAILNRFPNLVLATHSQTGGSYPSGLFAWLTTRVQPATLWRRVGSPSHNMAIHDNPNCWLISLLTHLELPYRQSNPPRKVDDASSVALALRTNQRSHTSWSTQAAKFSCY